MSDKENKQKKVSNLIFNIVIWVISAVLVIVIFKQVYCKINGKASTYFGYSIMRITTPSMVNPEDKEKGINVGDYILIKSKPLSQIEKDKDVITFYSIDPSVIGNKIVTHRVVDVEQNENGYVFTTKGDNNVRQDDYKVEGNKVIGVMACKLKVVTVVMNFLTGNFTVVLLIAVLVFLVAIFEIKGVLKKTKKEKMDELIKIEVEKLKNKEINIDDYLSEKENKDV